MLKLNSLCLIGLTLVLVSCTSLPGSNTLPYADVHKGSDGLVFSFLKDTPPDKVFEDSTLVLGLKLENKGAYDIQRGILTLSLEQDYLLLKNWNTFNSRTIKADRGNSAIFRLEGKSDSNTEGGKDVVLAELKSLLLERETETHTVNVIATACYDYMTIFQEDMCIDTDIYNMRSIKKVCEVKDRAFSNQGAPVAITKIVSQMVPHKDNTRIIPIFTMTVKNVGKGEIIDSGSVQKACSSSPLGRDELYVISYKAMLGDETLECMPKQFRLTKNVDNIVCELRSGISYVRGSYMAPLIIELEYGYTETVSKKMEIRRITV